MNVDAFLSWRFLADSTKTLSTWNDGGKSRGKNEIAILNHLKG